MEGVEQDIRGISERGRWVVEPGAATLFGGGQWRSGAKEVERLESGG